MPRCLFKVQEINSPIMGDFRGLRVVVALPNKAGRNPFNGKPCPSFEKPYRVALFGDYIDGAAMMDRLPNIIKAITKMGFDKIEPV
jgi:hypothetical protein